MEARGYDASSLTQSLPLLPFGCGGRYLHTDKSKGIRHDKRGRKELRISSISLFIMFRQNGVISSSGEVVSGLRGAALNQSRSTSGVYTGLLC